MSFSANKHHQKTKESFNNTITKGVSAADYCEAQARVRQGSARDGSQGERPQSLNPCLELTLKLVATHPPPPPTTTTNWKSQYTSLILMA